MQCLNLQKTHFNSLCDEDLAVSPPINIGRTHFRWLNGLLLSVSLSSWFPLMPNPITPCRWGYCHLSTYWPHYGSQLSQWKAKEEEVYLLRRFLFLETRNNFHPHFIQNPLIYFVWFWTVNLKVWYLSNSETWQVSRHWGCTDDIPVLSDRGLFLSRSSRWLSARMQQLHC